MNKVRLLTAFILSVSMLGNVPAIAQDAKQERRTEIQKMRTAVLTDLYRAKPDTRAQIANAVGYAVFNNKNVNLIIASVSGGYGVVRDNRTGRDTYMKMGEAGLGLGLGIKDFRAVFVFHNRESLQKFVNSGWEFGAHADAAAKAGDKGAAVGGEMLVNGITVYQLTENGLALQATVKGTKYWKDDELN
jgi:lipid-binding SYLF domain-containing protein